jgi:hypothetical protein
MQPNQLVLNSSLMSLHPTFILHDAGRNVDGGVFNFIVSTVMGCCLMILERISVLLHGI